MHPRALLSAPLAQSLRADQHNQLVCLSHDFVLFTPYIQKIFSLPHCRVCARFPKGSSAIFVQGANLGTEVQMGRDSTVMQFLCRDSNGQLCNTCTGGQLMCRGSTTVMQYLCRGSKMGSSAILVQGPAYVQGFQWAAPVPTLAFVSSPPNYSLRTSFSLPL